MDIFIEKIVKKRKTALDYFIISGLITLGVLLGIILFFTTGSFGLLLGVGAIYGAYFLSSQRNIEYEYIFTNGDFDFDRIIAQKRRRRLISVSCKNFDIVAKKDSDKFTPDVQNIAKKLELVSSMNSPDVYFITLTHKSERVLIFFEPDERMLDGMRSYIPRKVFK